MILIAAFAAGQAAAQQSGAEILTPREANRLRPAAATVSHPDRAPKPIAAPASLLRARAACPDTATLVKCRSALRKAYASIEWQRKVNLELAREMLGKLTDWTCLHQHEGAWNDKGDPYWGGLQMDKPFMRTYGPDMIRRHHGGLADTWTPREQIIVAQRAYAQNRGYNPWPTTGRACGLI